ncbi:hypothetical protein KM043_009616 [Ampulex compressa]|nr:hypothetical protein KM043_009616 [Ampulex compressa]
MRLAILGNNWRAMAGGNERRFCGCRLLRVNHLRHVQHDDQYTSTKHVAGIKTKSTFPVLPIKFEQRQYPPIRLRVSSPLQPKALTPPPLLRNSRSEILHIYLSHRRISVPCRISISLFTESPCPLPSRRTLPRLTPLRNGGWFRVRGDEEKRGKDVTQSDVFVSGAGDDPRQTLWNPKWSRGLAAGGEDGGPTEEPAAPSAPRVATVWTHNTRGEKNLIADV